MNSNQRFRARLILFGTIGASFVLAVALYRVQIINGSDYAAKASKQYGKPKVTLFDRGLIYFTAKDGTKVAAATVKSGYMIYMNPAKLGNAEATYEAISQYMDLDKNEFMERAGRSGDPYEELAHKVPEDAAISIGELGLSGIGVVKENWRSYPGNELSSQTLGVIGESKKGSVEGRYGLEMAYENVLKRFGAGGPNVFAELFSDIKKSVFGSLQDEGEIVTTIEPTVEKYLEKTLASASTMWHPEEIGGIVIDPKTGDIVAMASLPDFNPNDLSNVKNVSILSNPLVEHVYEMGSIMKPLTMAAGLDSGAITPESTYKDEGTMTLNGKKISNWDGKARGVVGMQEILSQSLNMGAATIALEVGNKEFATYFKNFGLGDKTGIDLPNEAKGLADNLDSGRDIEIATAAYGQGIAVSPIAMARALSILANGGYLVEPHIVKEIDYSDGTSQVIAPKKAGPILAKSAVDGVTTMLIKVVDTALAKGAIKNEHYSVAAKTGTAQIPDPVNKNYYTDRYLHSFFGYFPAYDPRFLVFLYQKYPKNAQFASETLTEPFSEISKFLIDYYDVPPDR